MTKKQATSPAAPQPALDETKQQRFDRVLSRAEFKPLRAVFGHLGAEGALMNAAIITTNSYQLFLGKLGFRVVVEKQIHENDCYARVGPRGGIRAVLSVEDANTYSTMVTLVNFDSTVSTTHKGVDFYDKQLAEFKTQLMSPSGNAG